MGESAEMSVYLELLRLGVMAWHGEKGEQRATIHRAVWELLGRAVLISTTQTSLCSPYPPACPPSPLRSNV